jgi:hypothetical protein
MKKDAKLRFCHGRGSANIAFKTYGADELREIILIPKLRMAILDTFRDHQCPC